MDAFHERLILRAATIDELLSGDFVAGANKSADPALLARRLAAWRRSSAAGDPGLFERRLDRDAWPLGWIEERLGGVVRRNPASAPPGWINDALWIEAALQSQPQAHAANVAIEGNPCPFHELFMPLLDQAEVKAWSGLEIPSAHLTSAARASLGRILLEALSELCTAALYDRFVKARAKGYRHFIAEMASGGLRHLFDEKPVLLRLIACQTRQWIDTSREFLLRLNADMPAIHREFFPSCEVGCLTRIEAGYSDPHNGGHSVLILTFERGERLVYKPKDLRIDVAWHDLVARLNRAGPPAALKAARALARDGYGWTEFVDHVGCADEAGCALYFRRAGAWLALLHLFAATDMHQENLIAAGEHPVPIDLETILQPSAEEHKANDVEGEAFDAALELIANSVMTVGLLPAYGRSVDHHVFAMGGMTPDWNRRTVVRWKDINSDAMRPEKVKEHSSVTPNLPHCNGRYAAFTEHLEDFISGFADYAQFLLRISQADGAAAFFADFAGLPVRKIIRPTRFYHMLLQRLKDNRVMDDGAVWSAQADFVARLSEWDESDPLWPLHRAEREALLSLNVPHFASLTDGDTIGDSTGISVRTAATPGLDRAVARLQNLDEPEIAWQIEVIRENTRASEPAVGAGVAAVASNSWSPGEAARNFRAEADRIAAELGRYAIRRGPGAAWIGLDWLGDAEAFQLVCLGPDLYNGTAGIALFLAAHGATTGNPSSGELAVAALSHLRKTLRSRNAARMARTLGIGGATGLGSIVYALAAIAKCLDHEGLRADARGTARLFTDQLIAADKQLDVMGGAAGAILGLLRLYRDTWSDEVLDRAIACGEHLLRQPRLGDQGARSWLGQGSGAHALNGMSHGAAGFAYALSSLAAAAGRQDFAAAAAECLRFEDSSYDDQRHNWPDLRSGEPHWPCQWCHGATGIGLARIGLVERGASSAQTMTDIRHAVDGAERGDAMPVDTLCCGVLGGIEFLSAAAELLDRSDLRERAIRHLDAVLDRARAADDYRWNSGKRRFNLGLFRGLSGVGYTLLRHSGAALPNVLIWE